LLDDAVIPLPKPVGGDGDSDGEEFRTSAILNDDSPPGARWSRVTQIGTALRFETVLSDCQLGMTHRY